MKPLATRLVIVIAVVSVTTAVFGREIRIVSYNVWHGIDGNGTLRMGEYESQKARSARFRHLVSGLKALRPDVLGIQEANRLPSFAERLACQLGYGTVWKIGNSGVRVFGLGIPVNFSEGIAVLARKGYGVEYLGARRLSGGGIQRDYLSAHLSEVRNAMAARVSIDGKPLIVFNTHTHFCLIMNADTKRKLAGMIAKDGNMRTKRAEIMKELEESNQRTERDIDGLVSFVRETTRKYNHPYIILGDFNTTLESRALQRMVAQLRLLDPYGIRNPAGEGYTWDPRINSNTKYDGSPYWADGRTPREGADRLEAEFDRTVPRRIDFIFLSRHFSPAMIKSAGLVFTEPVQGQFVSDHFGVEVVLEGMP
ncbi:MAG: endonuclease/exonuclease/phosphatase family protein [Spirochaetes bacterium]|nr:endonuclease/exonuclease/phosphatase family protein [Spirochaetota bacterium]